MLLPAVLQIEPASGGPFTIAATFLLLSVLFGVTVHIAARYVLGDVPYTRALFVGPVPAAITLLLQDFSTGIMLTLGIAGDFIAIWRVYQVELRDAILITVVHYAVSVLLSITVASLLVLLGSAPV